MTPPFQKDIDNLINSYVLILGIEPFPIATLRHTIFLQMNNTHHISDHILSSPDGFSVLLLALITMYFEGGGAKRDFMERDENEMVWVFSQVVSCLICRGGENE